MYREPKEGMMETVSHTFKRELDHVDDRDVMDALSHVINGSVHNSVYVCRSLCCLSLSFPVGGRGTGHCPDPLQEAP